MSDSKSLTVGSFTPPPAALRTTERMRRMLRLSEQDFCTGRYRTLLYRFLTETVPVVSSCIWTWGRLTAAPGTFEVGESRSKREGERAQERLNALLERVYTPLPGEQAGGADFATDVATGLFRDGLFGGFVTVSRDGSRVDRFIPIDSAGVTLDVDRGKRRFQYETDHGSVNLDRPDFYYIPLTGGVNAPLGRSVLGSVPFVSYIEQQLVDDMRRTSHNAGFHRLHVKITPPDRLSGESDDAYIDRINGYFDKTVSMIRSCDVDDNPVTWDNVEIQHIGPDSNRSVTNSWFFNHRAMVEEICAGTNLSPFLLGYSYGATTTWSAFKFDMVMRQVRTVQAEIARLFEWLARIDLALAGIEAKPVFRFDNSLTYRENQEVENVSTKIADLVKLYEAGLIDKQTARDRAGCLL